MNNEPQDNIRRYRDGSIDYSHYAKIARIERSRLTYKIKGFIVKLLQSIHTFVRAKYRSIRLDE